MKEKMILAMQEHTEHNTKIPSLTMQEGTEIRAAEIRAEDLIDEMWLEQFTRRQRGDAWSFFAWFDFSRAARRKDE